MGQFVEPECVCVKSGMHLDDSVIKLSVIQPESACVCLLTDLIHPYLEFELNMDTETRKIQLFA